MQHILKTGLAAGMSATAGIHSHSAPKVDRDFDGSVHVLPQSFVPTNSTRIPIKGAKGPANPDGKDVQVPVMCWGGWSWGDTAVWQWSDKHRPGVDQAWATATEAGLTWIDTAQAYGSGESERICGQLVKGMPRDSFVLQTKWYVVPDSLTNLTVSAPATQLKDSLDRLGLDYVDIYLVHGHIHARSISVVAQGLKECVDNGWTKAVGVANYNEEDMLEMARELAKYDIPLATNQCEYSVLRRHPETHGLLAACKAHGIVFQSYSSLAQGRLTGRFTADHEPPKQRRFSQYPMKELEPTIKVLEEIGGRREISTAAVALNYNLSKGVIPVVGVRSSGQVQQNAQALGWRLTDDELRRIDEVSLDGKSTILWQQG